MSTREQKTDNATADSSLQWQLIDGGEQPQQVMQGARSVIGGFSGVTRGSMAGSGIW